MFSKTTEMDSEDVVPASDSDDFSIQVDSDIIMNIKESCRTKKGAFALRNYFRGCKWYNQASERKKNFLMTVIYTLISFFCL
jgi:hypothetical protein